MVADGSLQSTRESKEQGTFVTSNLTTDHQHFMVITQVLSKALKRYDRGTLALSQYEIQAIKAIKGKRNKFAHPEVKGKFTAPELDTVLETLLSSAILEEDLVTELSKYKSTLKEIFILRLHTHTTYKENVLKMIILQLKMVLCKSMYSTVCFNFMPLIFFCVHLHFYYSIYVFVKD